MVMFSVTLQAKLQVCRLAFFRSGVMRLFLTQGITSIFVAQSLGRGFSPLVTRIKL